MDSKKANTGTFYLTLFIAVLTAAMLFLMVWVRIYPNPEQAPSIEGGAFMSGYGWGPPIFLSVVLLSTIIFHVVRVYRSGARTVRSTKTALEITSPFDNEEVGFQETVRGHVFPPEQNLQVLVYAGDNKWYPQSRVSVKGSTWSVKCQFGSLDSPSGGAYKVVALLGEELKEGMWYSELPTGIKSNIISVHRPEVTIEQKLSVALNERDGLRARLEGATNEIQSLTTKVEAAREESYEATKRANFAEQQSEARDKLFQDRENQLGNLLWLRKRMEDQAKDISEHVIVRKSKLYDLRLDSERCVIVVLTVRNESLFDVTIDFGKVSGCLFFNTTARHDPAHVLTKQSPPIVNLEPMVQSEIVIKQPLLRTESEIISESLKDKNARFWLGNLNIPISVTNIPQTVQSKPLRIGENVEYLYLKDYDNDPLEKVCDGEKLTIPEIRRRIDRLPPAERVRATQAALQLWGEYFYQPD